MKAIYKLSWYLRLEERILTKWYWDEQEALNAYNIIYAMPKSCNIEWVALTKYNALETGEFGAGECLHYIDL